MASAAIFAVVYATLGLFPVSAYVGVSSFLTFREILSPLAGMLFGPLTGGFSMVIGTFVDFAFGKPVVFDFLDFIPDTASAVMAGLVFTGRRKLALALPLVLILWYSLDPLSANLVIVGGIMVPFYWLHLLSVLILGIAFIFETRGSLSRLNPFFVGATVLASTMTGHIAGSIMFENVVVRINGLLTAGAIAGNWRFIFFVYPPERFLFTVLGTLVAVPVLRALSRRRDASAPES
ncbi:MAG: hypothetical protein OK452_02990 [Thaumarchaeota archaeon]|nr:hypothetical protein [Nitrososphaerota archaeon]